MRERGKTRRFECRISMPLVQGLEVDFEDVLVPLDVE